MAAVLEAGAHLAYIAVRVSGVVVISLVVSERRTAFAIALAAWAVAVPVVPRLAEQPEKP